MIGFQKKYNSSYPPPRKATQPKGNLVTFAKGDLPNRAESHTAMICRYTKITKS